MWKGEWGKPRGSAVKNLSAVQEMQKTWVRSLCWKIPWRRAWQPSSLFFAWSIPWTGEPDGLIQSMGEQEVGHDFKLLTTWRGEYSFPFVVTARRLSFPEGFIIRNFLFNLLKVVFTLVVVYLYSLFFLQMATYYTLLDLTFFT